MHNTSQWRADEEKKGSRGEMLWEVLHIGRNLFFIAISIDDLPKLGQQCVKLGTVILVP